MQVVRIWKVHLHVSVTLGTMAMVSIAQASHNLLSVSASMITHSNWGGIGLLVYDYLFSAICRQDADQQFAEVLCTICRSTLHNLQIGCVISGDYCCKVV